MNLIRVIKTLKKKVNEGRENDLLAENTELKAHSKRMA
jgi:hypothetical protein